MSDTALTSKVVAWRHRTPHGWVVGKTAHSDSEGLVTESDYAALVRERDEAVDDLAFVERWANHKAQKPHVTPEEVLSVIQHYPAITAITKKYSDGVVPDTRNPWAELAAAESDRDRLREALEKIARVGDGYGEHNPPAYDAGTTGEGHAECRAIARAALDGRE